MKIALVHDYLTQNGGAERVFELLCHHFPEADIYTSIYDPDNSIDLKGRVVHTTGLQKIPGSARFFRLLAPFYFPAFRSFDLQSYDLILSSTTSFAKAIRKRKDAIHICLCHNVTRFLWDTETYLEGYQKYQTIYPLIKPIFDQLTQLDLKYAQEPDFYIANSSTVADRIYRYYNRQATVVNYPIDDGQFQFCDQKEDYCLVSSRLLSYKRVDIIVEAFNQLGWKLIITGDGPELRKLEAKAKDNIIFKGYVSDGDRKSLMAKAQFVIVAALEDYGLVPIEANASGTPVICYGAGGVLDTQSPGVTGLFFDEQTPESLQSALLEAVKIPWDYYQIRDHALSNFTKQVFFETIDNFLSTLQKTPDPLISGQSR
jgi:glycosyltransferase involved in cell wall biosynthesis